MSREGRATPVAFRAYGAWLRTLARVAPDRADRALARRFCTPVRRRERPAPDLYDDAGFVVRNGGRLPVWRAGVGPRVLLVHGWDSRAAFWDRPARALVEAGFGVVTFDMPAHGQADGRRTNVLEMADAVLAVATPHGPFDVVVAHSAGAAAAALALRAGLTADRAVLIAPPVRPADFIFPLAGALGLPPWRGQGALAAMRREIGRDPNDADTVTAVAGLELPGLVIHDRNDRRTAWEEGRAVASAWPGARLLLTEGLGHNRVAWDGEVIREVVAFLRDTGSEPARALRAAG